MQILVAVVRQQIKQYQIWMGLLFILLFTQSAVSADYASFEDDAIEMVQTIPTSQIEAGMPTQPFEAWMQNLAGKDAELKWSLNDCGEGSGGPADKERDMPLCVSVNAKLPDGRWLDVSLGVANASDLESGHPPVTVGMRGVAAGYEEAHLASGDGPGPALFKLENFLKVDIRSIGLYYASARGDMQTAQTLLKQGVDIHTSYGQKAIFAAAENGQLPLVRLLLDAGADVNTRLNGETILSAATTKHGQYYPVKILALKPTIPVSPAFVVVGGIIYPLKEKPAYSGYEVGWNSYIEIAKLLIDKGADTYSKNRALQGASGGQSSSSWEIDLVRLLLKAGADVNCVDEYKKTPLIWAASENNVEMIRILLEAGADVNASSEHMTVLGASAEGNSAWTVNADKKNVDGLLLLLEHGAEVRPKNAESPLIPAVDIGSFEKTRVLLEHGADINATAYYSGYTPLMEATRSGYLNIIKLLIEKGADVNRRGKDGSTALAHAINNHHPQIAKLLRKAGAQ